MGKRGFLHRRNHRGRKQTRPKADLILRKNPFGQYTLSGMNSGSLTIENDRGEKLVNIQIVQLTQHGTNVIILNVPRGQKAEQPQLRTNLEGEYAEVYFLKKT